MTALMRSLRTIRTIGHSTRSIGEFLELLLENRIELLIDVRKIPRSGRNPQFEQGELRARLKRVRIGYEHAPRLGGLRKPGKGSRNTGWRNKSFQGYSDYMESEEFKSGLEQVIELARTRRVAIMCAEAVPWRCHRNLIADALTVRGFRVEHIMGPGRNPVHEMTRWARVRGTELVYA